MIGDVHPKVAGAGAGGISSAAVVELLALAGVHVSQGVGALIAAAAAIALGYLTPTDG